MKSEKNCQQYLTLQEIQEKLQVSPRTIRRLILGKGFPCAKVGNSLRFNPRNVENWLKRQEVNQEWRCS